MATVPRSLRLINSAIGAMAVFIIVLAAYSFYIFPSMLSPDREILGKSDGPIEMPKEYYNESYGYSIDYPGEWFVDERTENILWLRSKINRFDFLKSPKNVSGETQSAIQIQARDNMLHLSLEDWLPRQEGFPKFTIQKRILESGQEVYQALCSDPGWKARATYFVPMKERILQISYYANSNDLANQDAALFDAALNTFSFGQDEAERIAFETYQNGIYGFLVNYPTGFTILQDNYDGGLVAFTDMKQGLILEAEYVVRKNTYEDLQMFYDSREEKKWFSKTEKTSVGPYEAIMGEFEAETLNRYYFVETSHGYYVLRTKVDIKKQAEYREDVKTFLDSFRVYELLDTDGWARYESPDDAFSFLYPPEAGIMNVNNGVKVDFEEVTIGVYVYENQDLSISEWIDNRQLNKYKGADTRHFRFSVRSRVNGKDALRAVDPVGEMKLVVFTGDSDTMYIIDLKPFDSKDANSLALYNTIVDSLDLK